MKISACCKSIVIKNGCNESPLWYSCKNCGKECTTIEFVPPNKIYVQFFDEEDYLNPEPTWCEDKINDDDVVYRRNDGK